MCNATRRQGPRQLCVASSSDLTRALLSSWAALRAVRVRPPRRRRPVGQAEGIMCELLTNLAGGNGSAVI